METVGSLDETRTRAIVNSQVPTIRRRLVGQLIYYLFLTALSVIMLLPLIWMISGSLKARSQIFAYPPQWIPDPLVWQNYIEAWTAYPFDIFTFNSFKIALLVVVGRLLFCSMGGYGFARFDFPLKNVLFGMLIAVMLVPTVVNLVPLFILFKQIGWDGPKLSLQICGGRIRECDRV
ncbi:carbohydrate ABC transporter permease [Chloroflexi bacterium TSY]|nr:carbohydrate ABC transporter permease [Chloroflexi bacterium TSY]